VSKERYYVVWKGRRRGVYESWSECEDQVKGYVGAEYKAFHSLHEAKAAFAGAYEEYRGRSASMGRWAAARIKPRLPSVCVDAACSGSPGRLEFRGVMTESMQQMFREGPFEDGTNNVGEFLAVAQADRWLRSRGFDWPIYSDSETAIGWIRAGKCNTRLAHTPRNAQLFRMIAEAEAELRRGGRSLKVLKWETGTWGEIPADFGRK
jgi:ribonuclease HI